MKKNILAIASILVLSSCVMSTNGNMSGAFVFNDTTGPVNASSAKLSNKKGEACITNILGIVAFGDSSIKEAAKNGGIKEVATVDTHITTVIGVYGKSCTIVTGE